MISRRQLREWTGYARTSIRLDLALLTSPALAWRNRLRIPAAKYLSAIEVLGRRRACIRIGALKIDVRSISDLGTLHSAITDIQQILVPAGILAAENFDDRDSPAAAGTVETAGTVEAAARNRLNVIDVGANIGQFAAALLLAAPDAHLTCFEPDPAVFRRLSANLAGSDADLRCQAVMSETGEAPLYRNDLSVMSTMRPDQDTPRYTGAEDESVMVPVTTLDAAITGHEPVHLLKIDVEGAEYETLSGATNLLRRTSYLLVEMSLSRATTPSNLRMLELIVGVCPDAHILCFGRPLGDPVAPACQDVLIALNPEMGPTPQR